jgi:hypothetical protein
MIHTFFRYAAGCACLLTFVLPLSAQTITDGVIILRQGDKVPCKMVKLSKRKEEEAMAYNQVQVMDSTGTRTYLPNDLLGYVKDGMAYKAFNDNGHVFFAKCLVEGLSTLFYHPGGYGEGEERNGKRYIFKKSGALEFTMVNTVVLLPKIIGVPYQNVMDGKSTRASALPVIKKDTRFIDFFSQYFENCQGVVRKIKMEFYTISDIQAVFEEFNACKSAG